MGINNLNSADWPQMIYLLLLLMVISISLFSRGIMPFKQIIKYLGIWSAIALIIISLYSYRFEFSDFKNKVLGEISPRTARINSSGQMIINLARDGHFYLNIMVNNTSMLFMIDTGASDIVIGIPEAKKLGIKTDDLSYTKTYQTANGKSFGATIKLDKMTISDVNFYDISASVNSSNMGTPLLGMSFLRKLRKYEFYQDKLILTF